MFPVYLLPMFSVAHWMFDTGYSKQKAQGIRRRAQGEVLKSDIPNLKSKIERCSILNDLHFRTSQNVIEYRESRIEYREAGIENRVSNIEYREACIE